MTRATPPLDRVLGHLRRELSAPADAEVCTRLRPLSDGSLEFAWRLGERRLRLVLAGNPTTASAGQSLALGRLTLRAEAAAPDDTTATRLLKRVGRALVDRWRDDLGRWLAPGVDPRTALTVTPSPSDVARLLAAKLVPGVPFWRGWTFARVWLQATAEARGYVMRFERPGHGALRVALGDAGADAEPLCETALGTCHALASRFGEAPRAGERAEVLRAIGFLLVRCLGTGLRWAPNAASRAEGQPDEGLTDYCYRGSLESYRVPSRFFDLWGFSDSFGTAAENRRRDGGILHLTRECPIVTQVTRGRGDAGVRPWGAESFRERVEDLPVYTTDLDDVSLALGGEQKLTRLYGRVKEDFGGRQGQAGFLLIEGCESHIIGDSPAAVGHQCLHGSGLSLTALQSRLPNFEEADTRSSWARMLDDVAAHGGPRDPRAVNLFGYGYPDEPALRDLVTLLADVGVRVAGVAMPSLQRGVEQHLAGAALSLTSPWQPVAELITRPLDDRGLPRLELPLPHGWEGTLRWAADVCRALGLPPPDAAARDRWRQRLEHSAGPALADFAAEPLRLAFVVDVGRPAEVVSPRFFFGADPLVLAADGAVRLTVVHLPHAGEWRRATPAEIDRLAAAGIAFLEAQPDAPLDAIVADLDLEVVYCDTPDGRDVKHAGAAPVGITAFRPGLVGYAAWLNRLRALRRLKLYRRHGARL